MQRTKKQKQKIDEIKLLEKNWRTVKKKLKTFPQLKVLTEHEYKSPDNKVRFKYNVFDCYSVKTLCKMYPLKYLTKAIWTINYVLDDLIKYKH